MSQRNRKRVVDVSAAPSNTSLATPIERAGLSRGMDDIFDQFRRSFDELLMPILPSAPSALMPMREMGSIRYPSIDIEEREDQYIVSADLPGFNKEMVDVQINKNGLEIKAQKKGELEDTGKNYLHRERSYSAFQRSISFPEQVNPSKAEGVMRDGVLEIKIPKKEPRPEERTTKLTLK